MMATESPTIVERPLSPKESMVNTPSPSGPIATPEAMRKRTLGTRNRADNSCEMTPSPTIAATSMSRSPPPPAVIVVSDDPRVIDATTLLPYPFVSTKSLQWVNSSEKQP